MKRIALAFLLLLLGISHSYARGGGGEKLPNLIPAKTKSPNAPTIALFHGGRPWQGEGTAIGFSASGFNVLPLTSVYLDGHGGATIKAHPSDKEEPAAFDGITPTLRDSSQYQAMAFFLIPTKNQNNLFTPERIEALRAYVENGGVVLFDRSVTPALGDLLPIEIHGECYVPEGKTYTAAKPAFPEFDFIPGTVPVWGTMRRCSMKSEEGCIAHSMICDENGTPVVPFIAEKQIGLGKVIFLNTVLGNPQNMFDFANWAYCGAFRIAILKQALQSPDINPQRVISKLAPYPEHTPVEEAVDIDIQLPELSITQTSDPVQMEILQSTDGAKRTKFTFGNGISLLVTPKGNFSVDFNGQTIVRNASAPDLRASENQRVFDSKTAEAVDVKESSFSHKLRWKLKKAEAIGSEVILLLAAKDAEMKWYITAGEMNLDGRIYQGFADRIEVTKFGKLLSGVNHKIELTLPDPLFARRNSCYMPPRGYYEFDMTGKTDATTSNWGGFGSGQPFAHIACQNAVYLENIGEVEPCSYQFQRDKGSPVIVGVHGVSFGRAKAPVSTKYYWHWYSEGPERPNHAEYLAMYQFMRKLYRTQNGLKELPAYPIAGYGYQLTKDQIRKVVEEAAKVGYRFCAHPNPESPMDKIADPGNARAYSLIRDNGMGCHTWTAGGYVQGNGGWIYNTHPEWFLRDGRGKIHQYFGTYPVIDIHNPEFYDWYCETFKKAFDAGLNWVYRDMDGAASGGVNYAKETSEPGLYALVKFYRFFHENNVRVAVEGMNALVIDEYWYRPDLYQPFTGKEFALIGQAPSDQRKGGLTLDPFRTGMYNCFPQFHIQDAIFGVETIPGELERIQRTFQFVPKFNEALDICGMPYVRETPFGTTWVGDKGGALFFWNPAKEVTVNLPAGWKIRGVEGNVLTNVPADSIFLIDAE